MINTIIEENISKHKKSTLGNSKQIQTKYTYSQTAKRFKIDEFLLVLMLNVILLTVQLTIFNICFLIVFITTVLKFYKTYIMEKHVDQIQIPPISKESKTSILVYFFSQILHFILTDKTLVNNMIYISGVIGTYFVLKWVQFSVVLIIIVDVEYTYCLVKRWKLSKNQNLDALVKQSATSPQNGSSFASYKMDSATSLVYVSSSMKPIRSTFSEIQSEKNSQSRKIDQSRSEIKNSMGMIEEVQEHDKALDEELPQISTINILHPRNSTNNR